MIAMNYDGEVNSSAVLYSYNSADSSVETLCEIPVDNYTPPLGLAYDAQADVLYCIKSGEICPVDLQTGTIGEGVTEMPLEAYSGAPGCILDGGYYAYCGEGATIRNLDPQQKAQTKLRVNDSFWSDSVNSAYYKFANTHGDVSVVLSREYTEVENLIENMMNRDDRVDIYVPKTEVSYSVNYVDSQKRVASLYNRAALEQKDHYTVFFGGNHGRVDITTTAETGRCLLLLKDSYANCFVQFLYPHYDRILMVDPRYYYGDLENLISSQSVTDVLYLYNLDTFLSDSSLADVLGAE
jgi:hypothetical protein